MINVILLILLINSIYWFRRKPKALYCGLWCFSGTEPADSFKMRMLALYNESRGEHATGMVIDNEVIKETIKAREFLAKHADMFNFKELSKTNFTVLGHCRQATSGYSKENLSFAHPHAFPKNPDEADFMFMVHNGTVTNVSDLCHKYGLEMNYQQNSDSIVLGKIITKLWADKNHDIFLDYEGSATVIFYPKNMKNTLFVHKDKDRDLFYWNETPNKVYISSIKDSLLAIGADEVKEFKDGWLVKFTNGHITQEWDLTDKHPYSKPRVVHQSKSTPRLPYNFESVGGAPRRNTDGFQWDDHLIHYNGHAYTGNLFVASDGRGVAKTLPSGTAGEGFVEYWCIHGVIMKDEAAFKSVFTLCAKQKEFDPDKFKKLLDSDVSKYALYPIRGRSYTGKEAPMFWHPSLFGLKVNESYTWSPILSNKEFTCNRSGKILTWRMTDTFMVTAQDNASMSGTTALKKMITLVTYRGGVYGDVSALYQEYVKFRKIEVQENTYSLFIDHLIEAIADFDHIEKVELEELKTLRVAENYEWYDTTGTKPWELEVHLAHALLETCKKEREAHVSELTEAEKRAEASNVAYGYVDDLSDDDPVEAVDVESADDDSSWFETEDFKNALLFSNYTSLSDAADNYGAEDKGSYTVSFLEAINKMLYEIGVITNTEYAENKSSIANNHLKFAKSKIDRAFNMLLQEPFYQDLMNGFQGLEINLEGKIADIFKSIGILEGKKSPHVDDEIRLKIYKLALNYLSNSQKVDKDKLISNYNISIKEVSDLCHN